MLIWLTINVGCTLNLNPSIRICLDYWCHGANAPRSRRPNCVQLDAEFLEAFDIHGANPTE